MYAHVWCLVCFLFFGAVSAQKKQWKKCHTFVRNHLDCKTFELRSQVSCRSRWTGENGVWRERRQKNGWAHGQVSHLLWHYTLVCLLRPSVVNASHIKRVCETRRHSAFRFSFTTLMRSGHDSPPPKSISKTTKNACFRAKDSFPKLFF